MAGAVVSRGSCSRNASPIHPLLVFLPGRERPPDIPQSRVTRRYGVGAGERYRIKDIAALLHGNAVHLGLIQRRKVMGKIEIQRPDICRTLVNGVWHVVEDKHIRWTEGRRGGVF